MATRKSRYNTKLVVCKAGSRKQHKAIMQAYNNLLIATQEQRTMFSVQGTSMESRALVDAILKAEFGRKNLTWKGSKR